MQVDFRHARADDLDNIVATYNATIPSGMVTADLEPVSVAEKRTWFRAHSPEKRPIWIVSLDGDYAGWMSFSSFYGRPAYDGTVELSLYIDEKHRGRGLGKTCMLKALESAPGCQVHTLLGFIFAHNLPSISLFHRFGFAQWAHLPGIANMNGTLRDLLILGKKIG